MKLLIKYEFLKIIRRKFTFIVMAASIIVTAFLFALPVMQYQIYNQEGVIKGTDGIKYKKEQYKEISGVMTEQYIYDTVNKYQQLFKNPDNVGYDGSEKFLIGDAYWDFVAPREKLLNVIAANFDAPGEYSGFNKLPDLDMDDGANFYEARAEKIKALLNDQSRGLSKEQKDYWINMNSKVKAPFQYGYYEAWEIIISSFELLIFALLTICIVIAPVFSGEYQAGTDALILSGRYGKTKLAAAKIISSFVFGMLSFTLHLVIACGIPLAAFGADGWNLPLQIANTAIPYPLTFLQLVIINLGVIYLVLSAMIGLTLLLSAKMKNPYLVLTVLIPVLFIPMFLSPNGTTGIYNLTVFLLPYRSSMPEISKYISYQIGGLVFDVLSVRAVLYIILTMIMLPLASMGFKRHQVLA